jgi:hypothetical protein
MLLTGNAGDRLGIGRNHWPGRCLWREIGGVGSRRTHHFTMELLIA